MTSRSVPGRTVDSFAQQIRMDSAGATRSARINGRSATGSCSTVLEADGAGHWLVDGENAPHLDGCLDVDLESSAMTSALPVRRLGLAVAAQAVAPAAYVHAVGLAVDRLEQTYLRTPGEAAHQCYDYTASAFDFECRLVYDQFGLVLDYPGDRCPGRLIVPPDLAAGYPSADPRADHPVRPRRRWHSAGRLGTHSGSSACQVVAGCLIN